jgi:fatty-acyl-CoA synthase
MQSTMMRTPLSIHHMIGRARQLFPDREVISYRPDKVARRHGYAAIAKRANALARALRELGIGKGDRVATLSWNHHAHLECYFGIPLAGAVTHTLNLRLQPKEIADIARHAEDRILVVDDVLLPLYRKFAELWRFEHVVVFPFSGAAVPEGFLDYEQLLAPHLQAPFEPPAHEEDDAVAMCYTSGTTGQSKGVVYSHRSTVLHSLTICAPDVCGLRSADTVLAVTPMFHANSWGVPYSATMVGARLVLPGPNHAPEALLDIIAAEQPTMALGVPTIWMSLIDTLEQHPGRWTLPAGMRSLVGGAAVSEHLVRRFAAHGVELCQGWGMTETSPVATTSSVRPELLNAPEEERVRCKARAGLPTPLVELRLRDDHGAEVPWDGTSVGELQVRGPYITAGYHDLSADPQRHTPDGWLRTGDVASVDALGYVRITDRTKDLIKSGGEWISSVDLENALMSHPAIAEAAVIAIPHAKWQERPLACIVFRRERSATREELDAHLLGCFAKWQLPDRYEVLEQIPRTSTGKFWKLKLREIYRS